MWREKKRKKRKKMVGQDYSLYLKVWQSEYGTCNVTQHSHLNI